MASVTELNLETGVLVTRELTQEEIDSLTPSASVLKDQLLNNANNALAVSDRVALRCWKAGVAFPAEWQIWTEQCRAIANGTDATSTAIPAQPAYPAGT